MTDKNPLNIEKALALSELRRKGIILGIFYGFVIGFICGGTLALFF